MHLNRKQPVGWPVLPANETFRRSSLLDVKQEVRSSEGELLRIRNSKEPIFVDIDPRQMTISPELTSEMYDVEYLEAHGINAEQISAPYFRQSIDTIPSLADTSAYGIDFDMRSRSDNGDISAASTSSISETLKTDK